MSIVTGSGDGGSTKLIYGERVSKADLQVEAYGTIDELNSFLGLARANCDDDAINAVPRGLVGPAAKRDEQRVALRSWVSQGFT